MGRFKAKAEAAEHETCNWEVGVDGRRYAIFFSPGGRAYKTVPTALTRMDEGPKLPTRAEQIKAAGGIKARLALCLSRATLLAPDEVAYRRPTPSIHRRDSRLHRAGCLLYTSPSPRDQRGSRMPSSA